MRDVWVKGSPRAIPGGTFDLIKRWEGLHRIVSRNPLRVAPYLCPANVWTIGWGHLCRPDQPPIDERMAEHLLAVDVWRHFMPTIELCPVLLSEPDDRLAAVTSFTFNLGPGRLRSSALRTKINARDWTGAADQLGLWVFGGGKRLPGLVARRAEEARMLRAPRAWTPEQEPEAKAA